SASAGGWIPFPAAAQPPGGTSLRSHVDHGSQARLRRPMMTVKYPTRRRSIGAGDAEIDSLEQGLLHRAVGEEGEGIAGRVAVLARPLDRVRQRPVAAHDGDALLEIRILVLTPLEDPLPEAALLVGAPAERQDDGESDLPFAEVVAHVLAQRRGLAAIVER